MRLVALLRARPRSRASGGPPWPPLCEGGSTATTSSNAIPRSPRSWTCCAKPENCGKRWRRRHDIDPDAIVWQALEPILLFHPDEAFFPIDPKFYLERCAFGAASPRAPFRGTERSNIGASHRPPLPAQAHLPRARLRR